MLAPYECGTDMSPCEKILIDAYDRLGRPDLARYVQSGRKYHLLFKVRDMFDLEVRYVWRARQEFCPEDAGPVVQPADWSVWIEDMTKRYEEHQGLEKILKRHC